VVKSLLLNLGSQKTYHILVLLFLISFQKTTAATYYVNDNAITGDIYSSAVGNDNNDGTSAANPKLSIRLIYEKAQDGDTIIIDTGSYSDLSDKGKLLFAVTKKITFIIACTTDKVFSKTPLRKKDNAAPTEFYVDKDKPIDKETYLQKLQNGQIKKPQ
jgi:hypothetical protein